ncbi:MAG: ShlB/FhaC/HecB family hemolysin secretion/activation protein [Gammaproteobacteria bacterium]|nr:ShlB/FhaC/HecB family hemolysin secretion/activation protein [Gammaproteobacteria bacterium]MBQ0840698.1 ShlB/FhaC/HecB family hemolysin secretion/activation protein [Gammaproteobacteria bacterium]
MFSKAAIKIFFNPLFRTQCFCLHWRAAISRAVPLTCVVLLASIGGGAHGATLESALLKDKLSTPLDAGDDAARQLDAAAKVEPGELAEASATLPSKAIKRDRQPGAAVKSRRFMVTEYRVLGNSLLSNSVIERAVYPHLGPERDINDIEAARVALESAFREGGYPMVVVNLPQQKVVSGIVRLQVLEGRVDRLKVSGSDYFSLAEIREAVPSLKTGQIIDIAKAREEINALNRLSGDLSVTPVMKPGRTEGGIEVDLRVKDKVPVSASVDINDRYSPGTRELRTSVNLGFNNLWQKFHSFSLQYQFTPEEIDQVKVLVGTYLMPVNDRRDRLALYAVKSKSTVPAASVISVLGEGEIYGARYVALYPSLAGYSHSGSFGFDYKNFDDTVVVTAGGDNPQTAIDYVLFTAGYTGTFFEEKQTTRFGIGANFGINGIANDFDEFLDKRLVTLHDEANPNFFYLTGNIESVWNLGNYELRASLAGQYTEDLLISNEGYTIGGVDSVRGYRESEQLGDRGWVARAELKTPELFSDRLSFERGMSARLFAFYDYAEASLVAAAPDQEDKFQLAGTGLGVELSLFDHIDSTIYWALPLKDSGDIESGEERVHFDLTFDF